MEDSSVYRIIDANFNRSREGLRVCEEIVRLGLSSPYLTRQLKSVRHKISEIAKAHYRKAGSISDVRDSEGDVGRASGRPSEMKRKGLSDIFSANAERAKESLRVLEEFYKLIDKGTAAQFSRLRFRVYDIEKKASEKIEALRDN